MKALREGGVVRQADPVDRAAKTAAARPEEKRMIDARRAPEIARRHAMETGHHRRGDKC